MYGGGRTDAHNPWQAPMEDAAITPKTRLRVKPERPRLHKVVLVNDDYTPREFVVTVLKAEFRMGEVDFTLCTHLATGQIQ